MDEQADLLCLSHLRWGFVFQRPNHLMVRWADERRVFFVEEPIFDAGPARMVITEPRPNLRVCTPHLPEDHGPEVTSAVKPMLAAMLAEHGVRCPLLWFYTPMMMPLVEDIEASASVYDCMDELSAFLGAPPALLERERSLLRRVDLVFTGGQSLYEAKRGLHPSVHAFPSSVDAAHFAQARRPLPEPEDQRGVGRPRLGFFGVVDERMDLDLLASLADARPGYQIVMVGPVVKIDPERLPRRPNLHYLGMKRYDELPSYLAGWDAALMPFALNEATQYISPTKTLEYLAAGKPVVSTAIRDVVRPYGEQGLVRIAGAGDFAQAVDEALAVDLEAHRARCDAVLARTAWDKTFSAMRDLVLRAAIPRRPPGAGGKASDLSEKGDLSCSTI